MIKSIAHILAGREKQITKEETVLQPLPHKDFRFASPFILIHHLKPEEIAPGSELRIHPHPHRGFSPVTFMLQGEGFHKDNAGHQGVVGAGGAQWMFAGKGLLHSEGPTDKVLKNGGIQEFVQVWLNVPAAHKWDEPYYQNASKEQMPSVLQQPGTDLKLVSGNFDGQKGPLEKSFTPIISVMGSISQGTSLKVPVTPGYWTLLYIAKGELTVNDTNKVAEHNLIIFEKDNNEFLIQAEEDSTILLLSGEPIDEPVAAKDNFVMNTAEEADQAIEDYKNGVFGTLDF
ncbi:pirin family protein [Pseudoflavitalea sp. G-6-1-2]|uniref:pirin family protein n=1 Tax=Pseudoflavitalea sp. G-6-1-2 TaxID=2728841 RepID=UPI00146A5449|nr:pirin-like C-terminal cupin domain-containing protein [Pseudoflavitalea sp. G-6-1-2]NML20276.1 pirin family protein [Pseudoflavitalea sp. G-6-1-2]